jgi:hypothetical protein
MSGLYDNKRHTMLESFLDMAVAFFLLVQYPTSPFFVTIGHHACAMQIRCGGVAGVGPGGVDKGTRAEEDHNVRAGRTFIW